jgi:hypothetical protein
MWECWCLKRKPRIKLLQWIFIVASRTRFLQQLQHFPNIPDCCAFVSRCLVVIRPTDFPPLLYWLLVVPFWPVCPRFVTFGAGQKGISGFYIFVTVFALISFHENLITEPLRSSGLFLDSDWQLVSRRSASLYAVTNGSRTNGRWSCRGRRWSASSWFNVGGSQK